MREISVPASYLVEPGDNLTDDLFRNEASWPDEAGLKRKVNGIWTPV